MSLVCVPPLCLIVMFTGCIHRLHFPSADYDGSALLHTAHHTIITTDHGCRHPNLLTDSQAVIVCCTMQVSYGLVGVVGIGRKYSKPLVCISTLLHHVAYVTHPHTPPHTYGGVAQLR